MTKTLLLLAMVCLSVLTHAQVSKTLNIATPGTLSTALTVDELATVTDLTLTGSIDARDFKTMRDLMPVLAVIDMGDVTIVEYSGPEGTDPNNTQYPANEIPNRAFNFDGLISGKKTLKTFIFPLNIISIGNNSFSGCDGITGTLTLPSTLVSIGNEAYAWCMGLTGDITIPESVKKIGSGAFFECYFITGNITIPASVTSIGDNAFGDLQSLNSISVNADNPNYTSVDGILYNKNFTTIIYCIRSKTGTLTIPTTVTKIENNAFNGCSNLTGTLTIPSSVVEIGSYAFADCNKLTGNLAIPASVTSIKDGAFRYCSGLTGTLTIPSSVISIGQYAIPDEIGVITVDANNPLYSSQDGILYNNSKTQIIKCPKSLKGEITIASTVTSIAENTFRGCINLTGTLTIPASVTSIGENAFNGCSNISEIRIPASVGSIGRDAFANCNGLITIDNNNLNISIEDGVLYNKDKTTLISYPSSKSGSFTVPSTVRTIGSCAFYFCFNLTSIKLPQGLTSINNFAFFGCNSLTTIEIPSSVTSIEYRALAYCSDLKSIKIYKNNPLDLSSSSDQNFFEGINKSSCTLFVPFGTKSLYQSSSQWKDFLHIVERPDLNIETPGTLSSFLSLERTDSLTLSGTIDARDFKTMRDLMTITTIDLSRATISEYTGSEGPAGSDVLTYPANAIPQNAFYFWMIGNTTLKTIILPESIVSVEKQAFANCRELNTIEIPVNVKSIKESVFNGCMSLTSISLPNEITTIEESLFDGCFKLQSINLPNTVDSIGSFAFSNCSSLDNVIISSSVHTITYKAFDQCSARIDVDASNLNYSSKNGVLYNKDRSTLIHCPISYSGDFSFPTTVTDIAVSAFNKASSINSFTTCDVTPITLSTNDYIFYGVNFENAILYVPNGSKALYQAAEVWKDFKNIVETEMVNLSSPGTLETVLGSDRLAKDTSLVIFGEMDARDFKTIRDKMPNLNHLNINNASITSYTGIEGPIDTHKSYAANAIPASAFYNSTTTLSHTQLNSIAYSSDVSSIEDEAFKGCSNISVNLILSDSIKTIGAHAFENCSSLKSVTLPKKLETIAPSAFSGCSSIATVNLSDSLKYIGEKAFENCSTLSLIDLPTKVKSIGNEAFKNCSSLNQRLTFKNPETTIGDGSFYGCSKLFVVDLPKYLKTLPKNVFKNCTSLQNVNLTDSIITIEGNAFENCSGLGTSFSLPKNLITINDYAFANSSLKGTLTIPSSVKTIGKGTFAGCSNLTILSIPSSVSSIGSNAFSDCSGLKEIYAYAETPIDITNAPDVFKNVVKTSCTLHVPMGSKPAYRIANQWKEFRKLVDPASSLDDDEGDDLSATLMIYPNPVSTTFRISGFNELATVSVIDLGGNTLLTKLVSEKDPISLDELPQATYIVRIITNEGHAEKLLTKR